MSILIGYDFKKDQWVIGANEGNYKEKEIIEWLGVECQEVINKHIKLREVIERKIQREVDRQVSPPPKTRI